MRAVDEVVEEQPAPRPEQRDQSARAPRLRADRLAFLSYALLSVWVTIQLWIDPNGRVLSGNRDDHNIFLFFMSHGERVVFHGDNPFFSGRLNAPDGVNMMANTSLLALTLPMAPVTHFLGAGVTIAFLITLGLAATAAGWYWVLSRHLVTSRVAAWIGGLWCGFAPTMVSHANGHVNFVNQWVLPFIVWQVLRLREPGRAVRGGIILGLLITLQVFINEESLLFTALALGVFVIAYAAMRRRPAMSDARHMIPGLGIAAGVAGVLLAYPLWHQFFGPGHYHGQPFEPDKYATDLLSIGMFARQSLAGYTAWTKVASVSATEDNTFYGPVGLLMIVVATVVLWRSVAARAAAIAALVFLVVSMGPTLKVAGHDTGFPLPFGLVSHVPVIDLVSVTRFAMVTATIVGVLLALAADRARSFTPRRRRLWQVGMVLALVPLFPKPLPINVADPFPAFISQGMWRDYVTDDRTLVSVPLPEVTTGRVGQRWVTLAGNMDYRTPRGYFMGPVNPPADDTGSWSAPRRFTSDLLTRVREFGRVPVLSPADKAAVREDLIFWRAAVVVMVPNSRSGEALRATMTQVLGEPQRLGGTDVWDVRSLPVPSSE